MKLQKEILESKYFPNQNKIRISFYELHGGAFRCQRLGTPDLTKVIEQLKQERLLGMAPERRIVIYNSGMHDIHRLCDNEWMNDRKEYMTEKELYNRTCLENYEYSFEQLTSTVMQMDVDVRIFQTTTAAWPKYGNYGVSWDPRFGQKQPLDTDFVNLFNQIATHVISQQLQQVKEERIFEKLKQSNGSDRSIVITDTYWMTLSRPDNREIDKNSAIGKKLSHPGLEVAEAMTRIWIMLAMQLLLQACNT